MNFGDIPGNTDIGNFPPTGNVVGDSDQQTLTNKRINPRVATASNPAAITPNFTVSDMYCVTALAQSLTFNAPTGSPLEGNIIKFKVIDNGSAQNLTFNPIYLGTTNLAVPTMSLGSTNVSLILTFQFDSDLTKWRLTGKAT